MSYDLSPLLVCSTTYGTKLLIIHRPFLKTLVPQEICGTNYCYYVDTCRIKIIQRLSFLQLLLQQVYYQLLRSP